MLTSIYSYGQVAGVAHTYAAGLSMAVDLIRSAPLPAEHYVSPTSGRSAIVSIAVAPMPIWVLKTYSKLEENCRLLGSEY